MRLCFQCQKVLGEWGDQSPAKVVRFGLLTLAMVLLLASPEPMAVAGEAPPATRVRPRTLAAALEQQKLSRSAEAGLPQIEEADLTNRLGDLNAASLEACNMRMMRLISRRWLDLLERTPLLPFPDKVELQFDLYPDGSIQEMRVVGDQARKIPMLLCQCAVLELSPNLQWSKPMRDAWGEGPLHVSLVFYYESTKAFTRSFTVRQVRDQLHGELHSCTCPSPVAESSQTTGRSYPSPTIPWSPGWPGGYDGNNSHYPDTRDLKRSLLKRLE